ncbi:Uncharacterized protein dnm_026270 [Desulfonema magnum]|uniref:Uncharacterized protein n=1 Tax=Desulfonema magnum TaxID=45655 RepID=A0A975BJN5_9BACT|nr:Uncharacterized protein dnm_026270 [Desulfonema magnum]
MAVMCNFLSLLNISGMYFAKYSSGRTLIISKQKETKPYEKK